jgi:hypothetical protein
MKLEGQLELGKWSLPRPCQHGIAIHEAQPRAADDVEPTRSTDNWRRRGPVF